MSLSLINNIQMFMTDSEYDRAKGKSIHATLPKGHVFLDKYNIALSFGEVKVRPQLEFIAGEACHVLELHQKDKVETIWFAHNKNMLPMKTLYISSPNHGYGMVKTREVKEIASVATETGILWYPRLIMEDLTIGTEFSATYKVTIDEFVPFFKAPAETFSYKFPAGTLVWDKIQDIKYIAGPVELERMMTANELQNLESKPVENKTLPVLQEENDESKETEDGHIVASQEQSLRINNNEKSLKSKNNLILPLLVIVVTGFIVILVMREVIFRKKY